MSGSANTETLVQRSRVLRVLLAVVVTIPLAFSAIYMWWMWDPTKSVDELPVAVVNADKPFGDGDSRVSAGAQVTKNLLDSHALGFEAVDQETATRGLNSGDYYFVIRIPENFSETLAKIGSVTKAPALITVTYNDNNTVKASSIGAAAMSKVQAAVLRGVSSTTVGKVVSGVDDLGTGLKKAAAGSQQLSEGTGQLSDGADTLSMSLVDKLGPGVRKATAGSAQLASGSAKLSTGATQLQAGTVRLGDGATKVADGIDKLVTRVDIAALKAQLTRLQQALPPGAGVEKVTELLTGLQQLQAGSRRVATELTDPTAAYRSGVDRIAAGSTQLATGATQLSSGMQQINVGTSQLTAGAIRLQHGAERLDTGATTLTDGLSAGASKAPDMGDETQQESLAKLISTPVASQSENLARAQFGGPGAAPTLLIFASALVVIAVLLSFRGRRYILGTDQPPTVATVLRRAVAVCAVSLAGVGVIALGLWAFLDPAPTPASTLQVAIIVGAATIMNVAIFSVLFTVLGYGAGALTSLAWLMLQLFAYGGIWMVETLPAPLRWLHPVTPLTYVREGLIGAFNGAPGFGPGLAIIVLITVIATAINFAAVYFFRKRYANHGGDGGRPDADAGSELVTVG
ncbi:YhgE/Pip family protein [Gordonia sp. CPCC 205333]|uniref:YhgE/Pip domain-containing protein n=1 Tax=Gordonia sp. CPCC 205333 TaxID=3140790 RepID=UPI003AF3C497